MFMICGIIGNVADPQELLFDFGYAGAPRTKTVHRLYSWSSVGDVRRGQIPIDYGFLNDAFENGIIDLFIYFMIRLMNSIIWLMNVWGYGRLPLP